MCIMLVQVNTENMSYVCHLMLLVPGCYLPDAFYVFMTQKVVLSIVALMYLGRVCDKIKTVWECLKLSSVTAPMFSYE